MPKGDQSTFPRAIIDVGRARGRAGVLRKLDDDDDAGTARIKLRNTPATD